MVYSINGTLIRRKTEKGNYILDNFGTIYFAYIIDHPIHQNFRLGQNRNNLIVSYLTKKIYIKIEKDDIVIDCVANVGIFSAYVASKVKMLENTSVLYDNNITMGYGLSEKTVEQEIDISSEENNQGSASLVVNHNSKTLKQTETIKTHTIDDCVDFIKAEIEGADRLMLMGAKETIKN